jgi:hypothetical protein
LRIAIQESDTARSVLTDEDYRYELIDERLKGDAIIRRRRRDRRDCE